MTFAGFGLLARFSAWFTHPNITASILGVLLGFAILACAGMVFAYQLGQRKNLTMGRMKTGVSYWNIKWRPLPIAKGQRVQFWSTMLVMLSMGVGILVAASVGWISTKNFWSTGWPVFVALPLMFIGLPAWFMGNEIASMRRIRSDLIKNLTARENSCMNVLTEDIRRWLMARASKQRRLSRNRKRAISHLGARGDLPRRKGV